MSTELDRFNAAVQALDAQRAVLGDVSSDTGRAFIAARAALQAAPAA
jgi:hypothetical protein